MESLPGPDDTADMDPQSRDYRYHARVAKETDEPLYKVEIFHADRMGEADEPVLVVHNLSHRDAKQLTKIIHPPGQPRGGARRQS